MQYSGGHGILPYVRHPDLNIDNQTLVEECRSGDRDAMSILYTRFAPRMLHVISRYVSDRDSAQDILHDGFVAAFTRLDTIRDPEHLDFWLATIMKNLSLKYLQAQTVTSILEEIPDTSEESELDDIIDFTILESLIHKLPDGYRKVFRLAVLEGKSHKEISQILGIAPNSSSSQLFHAKLRLRELIKDYRLRAGLISILILLVSSGVYFLARQDITLHTSGNLPADSMSKKQVATKGNQSEPERDNASEKSTSPSYAKATNTHITSILPTTSTVVKIADNDVSLDSLPNESAKQYAFSSDSVGVSSPPPKPESQPRLPLDEDYDSYRDLHLTEMPHKADKYNGWSAGISVDPGMLSFNNLGKDALTDSTPQRPWDTEQPPSDSTDEKEESQVRSMMPRGTMGLGSYLASANHRHHLPVSFALTAERRLSSWLGLESGIGYSYLHTDFEHYNLTDKKNDISTCHWHYLEIPLKVNLYAYTSPRMNIYFSFGGRVAIPVYSYAKIAPNPYCQSGGFGSKAVWSVGGGVGASFRLSKRIDLFVEPSLRYHLPQDSEIPNIWTDDEPWTLSIPIGIRFSW